MFSKILVCNDGSAHAMRAARAAIEIARKFQSEVVVTHVLAHVPAIAPYAMTLEAAPDMSELLANAEHEQRATLACLESLFRNEQIPVRTRAENGSAQGAIARVAEEENVDLIIVGSRGMGSVQRLLMGSVSDAVVHHAHCPVLVVR
jgi:nucleotide-binding universal stress UspA family protein